MTRYRQYKGILKRVFTQHACSRSRGVRGAASAILALEGGEEVFTKFLRDVILQICRHE